MHTYLLVLACSTDQISVEKYEFSPIAIGGVVKWQNPARANVWR
jgi:hypothetical protein